MEHYQPAVFEIDPPQVRQLPTKIEVWGWWLRGYDQIANILNIKIVLWPGSLATLHSDIYDGKFDILEP